MTVMPNIPTSTPDDFRLAMRRLAATVSIITARDGDNKAGMAATAVTSLCMSPPSILVCVNNSASVHPLIVASGGFCVNVLHGKQDDIASLFGGKIPQSERFGSAHWRYDENGLPYLDDAQAVIVCQIGDQLQYGTHSVFIGNVVSVKIAGEVSPLVYADGKFSCLKV